MEKNKVRSRKNNIIIVASFNYDTSNEVTYQLRIITIRVCNFRDIPVTLSPSKRDGEKLCLVAGDKVTFVTDRARPAGLCVHANNLRDTARSSRLLLHDTNSWDLKKSYGCYDGILRDISWSDDSKYLLQVNSKGLVEILTAADHEVRSLQHIPVKDTWAASFHREGHRNVAIGTKSGNVLIWDTKNKTVTKSFPTPSKQSCVNLISFNARNTGLAATMQNGETIIYGLVSIIPVLTVKLACSKGITAMKFHHKSRSILGLATDEGHLILRDITTNKDKVFFENAHASPVSDFAYSLVNKDVMLSSGFDKTMHVYDVRLRTVVSNIRTTHTLTSLAISTENQVALGTKNGVVVLYDLRNLTTPYKILKGHDEEVRKVAFQPMRKKLYSTEVSLGEQTENNITPRTPLSPSKNNTSDIFYFSDSPPNNVSNLNNHSGNEAEDSFLVMMGLDESNNSFCEDNKSTVDKQNKERYNFDPKDNSKVSTPLHPTKTNENMTLPSPIMALNGVPDDGQSPNLNLQADNQNKERYNFDPDKDISKVSTPLHPTKTNENMTLPSPIIALNGVPDDGQSPNLNLQNISQMTRGQPSENIEAKAVEDLKDFIKLTLADVADDNRNYFLHIMMTLTKQKLYLEKQMAGLNEKIQNLANNQTALVETNRKLAYEIDVLKAEKHNGFI